MDKGASVFAFVFLLIVSFAPAVALLSDRDGKITKRDIIVALATIWLYSLAPPIELLLNALK